MSSGPGKVTTCKCTSSCLCRAWRQTLKNVWGCVTTKNYGKCSVWQISVRSGRKWWRETGFWNNQNVWGKKTLSSIQWGKENAYWGFLNWFKGFLQNMISSHNSALRAGKLKEKEEWGELESISTDVQMSKYVFSICSIFWDINIYPRSFRHVSRNMEYVSAQHLNTYFPAGT